MSVWTVLPNDPDLYHILTNQNVNAILAEGDSWLSIFFPFHGNLLHHLDTGNEDSVVLNLAYPGDDIRDMATDQFENEFEYFVKMDRFAYNFDLILLDGGGNDIVDYGLDEMLVTDKTPSTVADAFVSPTALDTFLAGIRARFEAFITCRNESIQNHDTPILALTYDYATPRNLGFTYGGVRIRGPWFFPKFNNHSITDPNLQQQVLKLIQERFRDMLVDLAADPISRDLFEVVDTLGVLTPAKHTDLKPTGDWHDELHPSFDGWKKLADKINPEIRRWL